MIYTQKLHSNKYKKIKYKLENEHETKENEH